MEASCEFQLAVNSQLLSIFTQDGWETIRKFGRMKWFLDYILGKAGSPRATDEYGEPRNPKGLCHPKLD
jgi:hypothetical protein